MLFGNLRSILTGKAVDFIRAADLEVPVRGNFIMTIHRLTVTVVFVCTLAAASAFAASPHVYVSGLGIDIGTCPRVVPCRTFLCDHAGIASGRDRGA
jgi:hypothetical protein